MDGVTEVEQRLEQLLDVTSGLIAARSLPDVAAVLIERGIAALGASQGALWLLDPPTRQLRMVTASALPAGITAAAWMSVPLDLDAPLPLAVRTGEPIFISSRAEYAASYPASYERIRATVTSADITYALVPLVGDAAPLGAIAVTYDRANAVHAHDRTYLRLLARQCALAIERVQLHESERLARVGADDANRAREEILAVVSHDLRNPLGTILMGASTLLQVGDDGDPRTQRIRTIAQRIQRQSERMARLIEDLVDFASLQAGTLAIERRPTAPLEVLTAAAELVVPLSIERGVKFNIDTAPALPPVDIDRDRAVQVLANLVANALKVTTKNGAVTIGATIGRADEVVFYVRDTGPGIDPAELPRLFDGSWRSKTSSYKGHGLALSIARGIVELHDGRIWADSAPGAGATFSFTLTPRQRS